ncbi:broad-complex core protein isoforms 1/2/3/4/5-like isoform X1 [Palaemon carinicauda]|uniref:broad-complex core protein isoforms 1/2/3/4/5-like isoform X1 n=1 Tax=Palaemon carinicauda TaxID=392227 RepID=UPI0035B5AE3C
MEDGLLSLKWNNHKSTFFHILSEVRGKHTYTDATLACEGKFYPVHKLVMSTCSDYFAEIFEKTPCKNPVVVLKDIKKSDLDALLDYMYIGEVDVRQSELAGLIKAAECLRIKGLAVPDEDPTKSQKKGPNNVPERREDSPPAKRKRRDSGERGRSLHSPVPRGSSLSSSSSSSHLPSTSSVPSHAPSQQSSVPESLVPSQSMLPPSGLHQESRHSDNLRGRQEQQSSSQGSAHRPSPDPLSQRSTETSQSSSSSQRTSEASMLPVQMIKVEVDEGTDSGSKEVLADRGEEGGGDIGDEDETSNNDFTDYQSHSGEIEKEEHDQMDSYGADQLPGPSGLQGGPPMLGWGDEGEGGFPHNLFSSDDPASQQACVGGTGRARVVVAAAAALDTVKSRPMSCNAPLPTRHLWASTPTSSSSSSSAGVSREAVAVGPGLADGAPGAFGWTFGLGRSTVSVDKHYPCHLCHYTCRSRVDLDKHIRTHTGEKPFRCHLCTYMSGDKSNLRRHMAGVHKVRPTDVALKSPVQSLANITFPTKCPPIPPLVLPPLAPIATPKEPPTPTKHSMKGPFIQKVPVVAEESSSGGFSRPSFSVQEVKVEDEDDGLSDPSLKESPCDLTPPVLTTGAPRSTSRLSQPHQQPGAGGESLASPHSERQ